MLELAKRLAMVEETTAVEAALHQTITLLHFGRNDRVAILSVSAKVSNRKRWAYETREVAG